MIKVILFDLDDTLLTYPQGSLAFVGDYLRLLDDFAHTAGLPPDFSTLYREGVRRASQNADPSRLLWRIVADSTGQPADELRAFMRRFHAEVYPRLGSQTEAVAQAVPLLQGLLAREIPFALATNPLYPQEALEERLRWAGLPLEAFPFARLTSADNSHFAKPRPEYYEELLAHLGYEPYEALMVGDDWERDILPARAAGLRVFWVASQPAGQQPPPEDLALADSSGSLADLRHCIERENWLAALPQREALPSHVPPRLRAGLAAILGMVEDIPAHCWHQRLHPREWTPLEILTHLADYEVEIQLPTLQKVLEKDKPFLAPPPDPFQPYERDLSDIDPQSVQTRLTQARAATLAWLEALPASAWGRPANHSLYGPTTLFDLGILATRHDQLHTRQLCQALGDCA
jgi:FMN phosphatase YigB (HAD superfamily)